MWGWFVEKRVADLAQLGEEIGPYHLCHLVLKAPLNAQAVQAE